MGKFSIATVFAAASLIALPAAAADLQGADAATVRIPVAGKSRGQLIREIDAAALDVCSDAALDSFCVTQALFDAQRQLDRVAPKPVRPAVKAEAAEEAVRISLKGKSRAQIFQEIDAAAAAVCKGSFEQSECVAEAAGEAKRHVVASARFNGLAQN